MSPATRLSCASLLTFPRPTCVLVTACGFAVSASCVSTSSCAAAASLSAVAAALAAEFAVACAAAADARATLSTEPPAGTGVELIYSPAIFCTYFAVCRWGRAKYRAKSAGTLPATNHQTLGNLKSGTVLAVIPEAPEIVNTLELADFGAAVLDTPCGAASGFLPAIAVFSVVCACCRTVAHCASCEAVCVSDPK